MARRPNIFKSIVILMAMLFYLSACENEVKEVQSLARDERIPMEVQRDFVLRYSDSSYIRMELTAPLAESYPQLNQPQREFREGIFVRFLDVNGNETSRLTAEYALQLIDKEIWEARGNVIVVNEKGEELKTEKLFWNSRQEIIYGDEFVTITSPDQIIMGEGFTSNQDFTEYELDRPSGQLNIEDDAS